MCDTETTLAECDFAWTPDRAYTVRLEVDGPRIAAFVDGTRLLQAEDATLPTGGIAVLAENRLRRHPRNHRPPAVAAMPLAAPPIIPYAAVPHTDAGTHQ